MRLGVSPFATTRHGMLAVAAAAIEGGIDTLWLGDGYLSNADFPVWAGGVESFTTLAWLAGRFPEASIGISAAVLPLRDPDWLVKQVTTLDQVTEGRFVLAVSPGFWEREAIARGVDFAGRGAEFDAALQKIRRRLPVAGSDGELAPPPYTPGGPPVWLAGAGATMRKALTLGLPFQSSRRTPAELAPLARRWFDEGGGTLAHRMRVEIGPVHDPGHEVAWHAVIGPPAYVAEQLDAYRNLGVADLSIVPGQDDATSLRTVQSLVADVLPLLT